MTHNAPDIQDIKAGLIANLDSLLMRLGLHGRRVGGVIRPINPTRHDTRAGSFEIRLTGAKRGSFVEYATGAKGDVFGLIAYILGTDFKGALEFAKDFLGLRDMSAARRDDLKTQRTRHEQRIEREKKREAQKLKTTRVRFQDQFDGLPNVRGTLGEVYLKARGIDVSRIHDPLDDIRFEAAAKYWIDGAHKGQRFPALVAGIRSLSGDLYAVQKVFLQRNGKGKADVERAKLIYPASKGAVAQVTCGASGLPVWDVMGGRETLVVCEGVEDALTIACHVPDKRVWAMNGIWAMRELVLPDCISEVVIAADNDWHKAGVKKALWGGVKNFQKQGRRVRIAKPLIGKDFNDWQMGVGAPSVPRHINLKTGAKLWAHTR